MKLLDVEQGTDEWKAARLGIATASRFHDIMATGKNGAALAGRAHYKAELVLERIMGEPLDSFETADMAWGRDTEPAARIAYALETGNQVQRAGLGLHDTLRAGASPDGLIGSDGGLEIKCLKIGNHLETLRLGEMPSKYRAQVQGNLWIFERQWWDFVSYDPRYPDNAQLFIQRIYRDDEYISVLAAEVERFLDEVGADEEFVRGYKSLQEVIV